MGSYSGQRRQTSCVSGWIRFAFLGVIISVFFQGVLSEVEPTESQCRPYIEKALKEQHLEIDEKNIEGDINEVLVDEQEELSPTDELTDSTESLVKKEDAENNDDNDDDDDESAELKREYEGFQRSFENAKEDAKTEEDDTLKEDDVQTKEQNDDLERKENAGTERWETQSTVDEAEEETADSAEEQRDDADQAEEDVNSDIKIDTDEKDENSEVDEKEKEMVVNDKYANLENLIDIEVQEMEIDDTDDENDKEETDDNNVDTNTQNDQNKKPLEDENDNEQASEDKAEDDEDEEKEQPGETDKVDDETKESVLEKENEDDEKEKYEKEKEDEKENEATEKKDEKENEEEKEKKDEKENEEEKEKKDEKENEEEKEKKDEKENEEEKEKENEKEKEGEDDVEKEDVKDEGDVDGVEKKMERRDVKKINAEEAAENEAEEDADQEAPEEEELIKEMVIPENLRPRNHIDKILKLEESGLETILEKTIDTTLKALKGLYDNAIKPLEMLYKYRDLSNRHFGDPEIFSKPLVLFMGPWSGGKSSTINYLLDNEFSHTSLRTGAEPSPAYFNILMHGEEEEILDGTQLAADWTFSGLQKFGQSLLDRLKGIKLPNKLLEKVNIVEIPGILEIRKQVQRLFPFNDACQWFIDRADIIFLVYDPSKLDVGPETEAILDQLKGREYQTRIILNKADQVKPEELMRVQGTLIWNISPLMSSSEPPIMYSTSLWSLPYEVGAPIRLLQAQERAFLRDLREAIDKRVENKISSARRFAVRVRNHAKMVDCYLTTYYNHKTIFGNRKKISDDIIEYPQKYHIYEGLSTLTNISRYDLPDPDVYKDFFKINPLYEFKKLSETCTYFRGCPINKLDVAIAYDLPELVGKYRKAVETAKEQLPKENS